MSGLGSEAILCAAAPDRRRLGRIAGPTTASGRLLLPGPIERRLNVRAHVHGSDDFAETGAGEDRRRLIAGARNRSALTVGNVII